ncbi:hypothetical protein HK102_009710 [Quaeritorhiza haematococci]|nr:hypothetical protein HK102_009710 [Quaeritorhiza haematococci]
MAATFKAITLDKVLRGETQFPVTVVEFKAYLTDVTKDVENLLFVLDYEQYRQLSDFYLDSFNIGTTSLTTLSMNEGEAKSMVGEAVVTKMAVLEEDKEVGNPAFPDTLGLPTDSDKPAAKAINAAKDPEKTSHCINTTTFQNKRQLRKELILRLVTFGILKAHNAIVGSESTSTTPDAPVIVNLSAISAPLIKEALHDPQMFQAYQRAECQRFMERYFDSGCPFELNIPSSVKTPIVTAVKNGSHSPDVFEKAYKETRNNLERNALPRFLKYITSENIGAYERRKRLERGLFFFGLFLAVDIPLFVLGINNFARLGGAFFLFVTWLCVFQYVSKFCVNLGHGKKRSVEKDKYNEQDILAACVLEDHRTRTRKIYVRSGVAFLVSMAIITGLPPWNFIN